MNGGTSINLLDGRLANFWIPIFLLKLLHCIHLNNLLGTAKLRLTTQYPDLLSSFNVAPLPPRAHLAWHHLSTRSVTFSCFGSKTGCLKLLLRYSQLQPSTNFYQTINIHEWIQVVYSWTFVQFNTAFSMFIALVFF